MGSASSIHKQRGRDRHHLIRLDPGDLRHGKMFRLPVLALDNSVMGPDSTPAGPCGSLGEKKVEWRVKANVL